jgi:hypothetical protein
MAVLSIVLFSDPFKAKTFNEFNLLLVPLKTKIGDGWAHKDGYREGIGSSNFSIFE